MSGKDQAPVELRDLQEERSRRVSETIQGGLYRALHSIREENKDLQKKHAEMTKHVSELELERKTLTEKLAIAQTESERDIESRKSLERAHSALSDRIGELYSERKTLTDKLVTIQVESDTKDVPTLDVDAVLRRFGELRKERDNARKIADDWKEMHETVCQDSAKVALYFREESDRLKREEHESRQKHKHMIKQFDDTCVTFRKVAIKRNEAEASLVISEERRKEAEILAEKTEIKRVALEACLKTLEDELKEQRTDPISSENNALVWARELKKSRDEAVEKLTKLEEEKAKADQELVRVKRNYEYIVCNQGDLMRKIGDVEANHRRLSIMLDDERDIAKELEQDKEALESGVRSIRMEIGLPRIDSADDDSIRIKMDRVWAGVKALREARDEAVANLAKIEEDKTCLEHMIDQERLLRTDVNVTRVALERDLDEIANIIKTSESGISPVGGENYIVTCVRGLKCDQGKTKWLLNIRDESVKTLAGECLGLKKELDRAEASLKEAQEERFQVSAKNGSLENNLVTIGKVVGADFMKGEDVIGGVQTLKKDHDEMAEQLAQVEKEEDNLVGQLEQEVEYRRKILDKNRELESTLKAVEEALGECVNWRVCEVHKVAGQVKMLKKHRDDYRDEHCELHAENDIIKIKNRELESTIRTIDAIIPSTLDGGDVIFRVQELKKYHDFHLRKHNELAEDRLGLEKELAISRGTLKGLADIYELVGQEIGATSKGDVLPCVKKLKESRDACDERCREMTAANAELRDELNGYKSKVSPSMLERAYKENCDRLIEKTRKIAHLESILKDVDQELQGCTEIYKIPGLTPAARLKLIKEERSGYRARSELQIQNAGKNHDEYRRKKDLLHQEIQAGKEELGRTLYKLHSMTKRCDEYRTCLTTLQKSILWDVTFAPNILDMPGMLDRLMKSPISTSRDLISGKAFVCSDCLVTRPGKMVCHDCAVAMGATVTVSSSPSSPLKPHFAFTISDSPKPAEPAATTPAPSPVIATPTIPATVKIDEGTLVWPESGKGTRPYREVTQLIQEMKPQPAIAIHFGTRAKYQVTRDKEDITHMTVTKTLTPVPTPTITTPTASTTPPKNDRGKEEAATQGDDDDVDEIGVAITQPSAALCHVRHFVPTTLGWGDMDEEDIVMSVVDKSPETLGTLGNHSINIMDGLPDGFKWPCSPVYIQRPEWTEFVVRVATHLIEDRKRTKKTHYAVIEAVRIFYTCYRNILDNRCILSQAEISAVAGRVDFAESVYRSYVGPMLDILPLSPPDYDPHETYEEVAKRLAEHAQRTRLVRV